MPIVWQKVNKLETNKNLKMKRLFLISLMLLLMNLFCLNSSLIRWTLLCTHGAAGPSGVDAYVWQRSHSSFSSASVTLCSGLASVAHCLHIDDVISAKLLAFVACWLIPLDKKPGVCLIGVGDVSPRIIAKAIVYAIGNDIQL